MALLQVSIDEIEGDVDADEKKLAAIAKGAAGKPSLSPKNNAGTPIKREKISALPLVREGYSMPAEDHAIVDLAIQRIVDLDLLPLRQAANKSLILRMALHALAKTSDDEFKKMLAKAPPLQVGRKAV